MGGPERRRRSCFDLLPRGNDTLAGAPDKRGWVEGVAYCQGQGIGLIGMLDRDKQERDINASGAQLFSNGLD